ncbi:hypothetical protein [Bradyrhizobium sp. JYMT SZCCT0428]|uniref:hypothetical protein n=1 Tax=Bradyrhizobium sp. JYMT SZCCT0428 TaxID=2807673 RepID=UPI001BAE43F5|nr:hypothetical protein [Bradyrhizobium sp. JYMT SZCCT0428]MBR1152656.1 hypothetical protein [Bradyrhizobium sp. JYMT SZCCT0428]
MPGIEIVQARQRFTSGMTDTGIMAESVYCTYFDHNYLSRGLALYHSLQQHEPGARLWVLCMSEACHRILTALDLPDLRPVRLEVKPYLEDDQIKAIRSLSVGSRRDHMFNVFRRVRVMAFHGIDIVTGRVIVAPGGSVR